MSHLNDGLGKEQVQTVSGADLQTQNTYFTGSMTIVSGLEVPTGGITNSVGLVSNVGGIGSPTTWGLITQTGSFEPSGTTYVVTFDTAFGAIPTIQLNLVESGATASMSTIFGIATASAFSGAGISGIGYNYVAIGVAA